MYNLLMGGGNGGGMLVMLAVVIGALWLTNLLAWAKYPSPLSCFNKAAVEVVETAEAAPCDSISVE